MGIFVDTGKLKKVKIEDVEFTIKPLLGEEIEMLEEQMGEFVDDGIKRSYKPNFSKVRTAKIKLALVSWSAPEPLNEENIKRLKLSVREKLVEEIDKLSYLDEETKKKSKE